MPQVFTYIYTYPINLNSDFVSQTLSMKLSLVLFVLGALVAVEAGLQARFNTTIQKSVAGKRIYAHMMPWFETKESSGNGQWGIHWTMATRNPDNIVDGKREIASWFYPQDGPYASADGAVIERQLLQMQMAGIDGIFLDWPGTQQVLDYPKNAANGDAIVNRLADHGLEFAVVYEDNNLSLGGAGDPIGQARADLQWLQSNYFSRSNYVRVNGAPLLLDFGPQNPLNNPDQWTQVLSAIDPKKFVPLWNNDLAGNNANGHFPWIWMNYVDGLNQFYNDQIGNFEIKVGVAYPGFRDYYSQGGWGGATGWTIDVSVDTFRTTLNLAIQSQAEIIQVATWNDYGEGTIIEPTAEFGDQFLQVIQQSLGVKNAGPKEFQLIRELYQRRVEHKGNAEIQSKLDEVAAALRTLKSDQAEEILKSI